MDDEEIWGCMKEKYALPTTNDIVDMNYITWLGSLQSNK